MSQVGISLSKYHPTSLHLPSPAQSADPLQHASCITWNFNLKNIHRKEKILSRSHSDELFGQGGLKQRNQISVPSGRLFCDAINSKECSG